MIYVDEPATEKESEVIDKIVDGVIALREKKYEPGTVAKRGLHSKSNGFVEALFRVRPLDKELAIGLFSKPDEYKAVMRFSNGAFSAATPDAVPNIRGLAIKIYGVSGEKSLPEFENSGEHDFVMANHEAFFVKDIDDLLLLTTRQLGKAVLHSPSTVAEVIKATSKIVASPLDIDYFSQVPHRFGDRACKYSLIHQKGKYGTRSPNFLDRDYLRKAASRHLHQHSAKFTFCVQLKEENDSISDSTRAWTGPKIPLADVTIPAITHDLQERDGEAVGFNPFCVLAEHEPLGWPGRLRKRLYLADWQWRNDKNESLRKASSPTGE